MNVIRLGTYISDSVQDALTRAGFTAAQRSGLHCAGEGHHAASWTRPGGIRAVAVAWMVPEGSTPSEERRQEIVAGYEAALTAAGYQVEQCPSGLADLIVTDPSIPPWPEDSY